MKQDPALFKFWKVEQRQLAEVQGSLQACPKLNVSV